eukprot:1154892-Pelagomonas_calceolata.AAC.2
MSCIMQPHDGHLHKTWAVVQPTHVSVAALQQASCKQASPQPTVTGVDFVEILANLLAPFLFQLVSTKLSSKVQLYNPFLLWFPLPTATGVNCSKSPLNTHDMAVRHLGPALRTQAHPLAMEKANSNEPAWAHLSHRGCKNPAASRRR